MANIFSQVPGFKESRLRSLYSDFSHLKEINPEGFDANIAAWRDVLDISLNDHFFESTITLPGAELASKLADSTYGHPKGLSTVLDVEVQLAEYVPWSIYKYSSPESPWSLKDYISPIRWLESKLKSYRIGKFSLLDGKGGVCNDYFINWKRMIAIGNRVGDMISAKVQSEGTHSAGLLDNELFVDLVKKLDPSLSDLDIQVLLIYLSRDCGKLTVVSDKENAPRAFVKVGRSPITDEDIGIIKVKSNIRSIQSRTDILAERLDKEIPEKVQMLLQKGKNDDRLKNVLVQKAYMTNSMNKSLGILSQLNMILDKINDAQTNISVYSSLRTAKEVLEAFNNQISLADLESVQLELDQEIAISNDLTEAMKITPDLDESAIDDELKELEKQYLEEKNRDTGNLVGVSEGIETHNGDRSEVSGSNKESESQKSEDKALIDKLLALKLNSQSEEFVENNTSGSVDTGMALATELV